MARYTVHSYSVLVPGRTCFFGVESVLLVLCFALMFFLLCCVVFVLRCFALCDFVLVCYGLFAVGFCCVFSASFGVVLYKTKRIFSSFLLVSFVCFTVSLVLGGGCMCAFSVLPLP